MLLRWWRGPSVDFCSDYAAPAGLPLILQIGPGNLTPDVTSIVHARRHAVGTLSLRRNEAPTLIVPSSHRPQHSERARCHCVDPETTVITRRNLHRVDHANGRRVVIHGVEHGAVRGGNTGHHPDALEQGRNRASLHSKLIERDRVPTAAAGATQR
jgi:hypothetical protein